MGVRVPVILEVNHYHLTTIWLIFINICLCMNTETVLKASKKKKNRSLSDNSQDRVPRLHFRKLCIVQRVFMILKSHLARTIGSDTVAIWQYGSLYLEEQKGGLDLLII